MENCKKTLRVRKLKYNLCCLSFCYESSNFENKSFAQTQMQLCLKMINPSLWLMRKDVNDNDTMMMTTTSAKLTKMMTMVCQDDGE